MTISLSRNRANISFLDIILESMVFSISKKESKTGICGLFVMQILRYLLSKGKKMEKTFSMLYIYPSLLYLESILGRIFFYTYFFFLFFTRSSILLFCDGVLPCVIMEKKNILYIFFLF